jgi:hypothetical protein
MMLTPHIEALEDRSLMSTVAYGDFNHDGRVDKAVVTNSTTITVSLAKADGNYTVSAILTTPKTLPISSVNVSDVNGDGKPDVSAGGISNNRFYNHTWLGNGDGTFGGRITDKGKPIPPWGFF